MESTYTYPRKLYKHSHTEIIIVLTANTGKILDSSCSFSTCVKERDEAKIILLMLLNNYSY